MAKAKKPAPRKARRANRATGMVARASGSAAALGLLAASVDPFNINAQKCKIHDANAERSFTYQSRTYVKMGTDTSSATCCEFYPYLKNFNREVTGAGGLGSNTQLSGAPVVTARDVSDYSTLTSAGATYRIVSWGLRVSCIQAPLHAQGRLHVKTTGTISLLQGNQFLDIYGSENHVFPINQNLDIVIVPNHRADYYTQFREMDATGAFSVTDENRDAPYEFVNLLMSECYLSGVTEILNVEVVYNIEVIPKLTSLTARLTTPAAPHRPELLAAIHNTRTSMPLAHPKSTFTSKLKQVASRALSWMGNKALAAGASYLGGLFGGPAGASSAYHLMDRTGPAILEVD